MAQCITQKGRSGLMEYYPAVLFKGEKVDKANQLGSPKTYKEKLTVELLEQHQALSESCK